MLYLNTRHRLPQIGMETRLATLSSRIRQPESSGNYRAARSNMGITQCSIEVDTYPSRHSYGFSTMGDFTKEKGDQGKSDIRQTTSGHTQTAWAMIYGAAKKGNNEIANQAHSKLASEVSKKRYMVAEAIPDPKITVHQSQLRGQPDPGHQAIEIQTYPTADVTYNPGKFSVYLQDKGFIRNWVSEGHYDILA
ncbi:MAG: hypothetical protein IJS96_01960 [Schwartzia sp.]|nr:hypothetical protein [Schwartzia sp. (in: firmicutes)]